MLTSAYKHTTCQEHTLKQYYSIGKYFVLDLVIHFINIRFNGSKSDLTYASSPLRNNMEP